MLAPVLLGLRLVVPILPGLRWVLRVLLRLRFAGPILVRWGLAVLLRMGRGLVVPVLLFRRLAFLLASVLPFREEVEGFDRGEMGQVEARQLGQHRVRMRRRSEEAELHGLDRAMTAAGKPASRATWMP